MLAGNKKWWSNKEGRSYGQKRGKQNDKKEKKKKNRRRAEKEEKQRKRLIGGKKSTVVRAGSDGGGKKQMKVAEKKTHGRQKSRNTYTRTCIHTYHGSKSLP